MLATGTSRNSLRRQVGRPALLLLGISVVLLIAVFATAAAAYAWPNDLSPTTSTTVVGDVNEFEPGSATPLWEFGIGGYLVRLETGEFLAFDRAEPVIGCSLVWGQPRSLGFKDPCRGFEYDINGDPSPENRVLMPMNQFDLDTDRHGTIRVTSPTEPR